MSWKNQFHTKSFEEFVKRFFKDTAIGNNGNTQYFNKKVVLPVYNDKVAEIVLSTNGVSGTYVGFKVTITHKTNGIITKEWFGFKEYLMDGYKSTEASKYPHVIEHCDYDWYMNGAEPKAMQDMAQKILDYINLYKEMA